MVDQTDFRQTDTFAEKVYVATQWQLIWWRFKKHKLALFSGIIIIFFYLVAFLAPFFAVSEPSISSARRSFMPPQGIHFFDEGKFRPFVYGFKGARDPKTFKRVYKIDETKKYPIEFFARGFEYEFLGLFKTDLHFIGVSGAKAQDVLFLLGTDQLGRDLYSRMVYANRVSLSIGLAGVSLAFVLGVLIGGISGYYGGYVDAVIQRLIEILRSIPTIPLWMGLAAALPQDWSVLQIYFAITIIISLLGWTELARVVRGRFLAIREEDFVTAATLTGATPTRTIVRHMVPSMYSHIIAAMTLAFPNMIISETSLSFLGLGIRPPAISYGTLLQAAQNIQTVASYHWLMIPAIPVIVIVLAFNFLGDGVRDAADPYSQ